MPLRTSSRRIGLSLAASLRLDALARAGERMLAARRGMPTVRVFYLHATPRSDAARLRQHIDWLQANFRVIDFRALTQLPAGRRACDPRPAALLTFDDGLRSNYEVAAPLLEAAGLRALFFVIPGFAILDRAEAERFYRERIRKRSGFEPSMTPDEIADLAARGHAVGNHTYSHARLCDTPAADLDREIVESAAVIESWTGRPVEAFAWPFVWSAISSLAYRVATARHAYCFAPCAGTVDVASPHLVWRTNLEARYSPADVRVQCSALADLAAAHRRILLSRRLRVPREAPAATPIAE